MNIDKFTMKKNISNIICFDMLIQQLSVVKR